MDDAGRLLLERSGGVAGITLSASIDPESLSTEQRAAVEGFLSGRSPASGPPAPDRFVYRFELGSRQALVSEDRMPDALRPLLRRLAPRFNRPRP
jgi:hypothetical protein